MQSSPNLDCMEFVNQYSDDKGSFWVAILQTPEEFENIVFNSHVGDITKPFYTPQGIHIVKILDRVEIGSFDEMKDHITKQFQTRSGGNKGIESKVAQLKQDNNFQLTQKTVDALLDGNDSDGALFYLTQQPFSCESFRNFS